MIIKSVSQYVDYLESKSCLNGHYAFRGHSNTEYKLSPLINRNDDLRKEKDFIEIPQLQFPDVFKSSLSPINLLALLQHYGFPTRLFDVTMNPLVALYFSVCSPRNKEKDGEVIIFHYLPCGLLTEEVEALAVLYKYNFISTGYSIDDFLREQGIRNKSSINMHTSNYERIFNQVKSPFFVKALYATARQRAQKGCYIFFPNKFDEETDTFLPEIIPIEKVESEIVREIVIVDKESKESIKKELEVLGFDKLTLFPEDFDGNCKRIKDEIEDKN